MAENFPEVMHDINPEVYKHLASLWWYKYKENQTQAYYG